MLTEQTMEKLYAMKLNGLAEAASELRRSILDALRRDDIAPCEAWMETMDDSMESYLKD